MAKKKKRKEDKKSSSNFKVEIVGILLVLASKRAFKISLKIFPFW